MKNDEKFLALVWDFALWAVVGVVLIGGVVLLFYY